MKELQYIPLQKDNEQQYPLLESLMLPYTAELDEHAERKMPQHIILKWIKSIQTMQGPADRHFEFCYDGDTLIGFLYGKVDHEDHRGFIKPGWGYVMEFCVLPEHRRKGYGKAMYAHLEELFLRDGVKNLYLTSDPVTGKPFWSAMGFAPTGEYSPENKMELYEKAL